MKARQKVLLLLSLLSVITYLDRVCISVAGPAMQTALGLGPSEWGWVTGAFALEYALFEAPSGSLGDRMGPRRVLTRIVLWWSAFTSLTGVVSGFAPLVAVRFLFGMGEAGAYPNIGVSIGRWFPLRQRAMAWGVVMMAAQIGGALAPFLVVPIQQNFGWRASFWVFGTLGIAWAGAWYFWFRDWPAQMPGISPEEIAESEVLMTTHQPIPWSIALASPNLWALMAMAAGAGYSLTFFQTWLGTYLVRARGFTAAGLVFAALPFVVAAVANFVGGVAADSLVRRVGLRQGRRTALAAGYAVAAVFLGLGMVLPDAYTSLTALSLAYGGLTFAQPALMSVCVEMGGEFSGAVTGLMNSAAYGGGFLSSVIYGQLAESYGYTVPFVPMVVFAAISAGLALVVDAERRVVPVSA